MISTQYNNTCRKAKNHENLKYQRVGWDGWVGAYICFTLKVCGTNFLKKGYYSISLPLILGMTP